MTDSPLLTYLNRTHPRMNDETVIQGDHWRIGILTESLIRLEWSDRGMFEDHPTQMVVSRDFGGDFGGNRPSFTVRERNGLTIIDTPALRLSYDGRRFSKEGLSVAVKGLDGYGNVWHYGDDQFANLHGTARTLDSADGPVPLDNGVISRDGWAVLDDSASNVIVRADTVNGVDNPYGVWVEPRDHVETDLYFFGYGHRYIEAVRDFYRLTGPTPLLPRFALGNWWSRYHRYDEHEYLALMDRFVDEGIPFTTAVIDMDWHLVDGIDPKYGSGWTGYTWNRDLFPDPERFLAELHRRGLRTTLNVHPRDGIRAFEDYYAKAAEAMGVDPASGEPVEFDLTDPKFVRTYFDMHHELESEGVDFWWLDWQQGGVTRQTGLDPLWALNHMHYLDSGRDGRWPLTFSRYAGPGSHRYPVGFSGDTVVSWDSLRFQPYFTATASNIGYGWWSHDIGGHMLGERDEELEARWYQLGAFSPINRLHSTNSMFTGKEPWNFHEPVRSVMTDALRLRQRLMPYLYTMNWRAAIDGRPLVEPMYWQDPDHGEAYDAPDEFRFGTELVVAPITSPVDRAAQRASADVWLPEGEWFDFFNGRRYSAPAGRGMKLPVWRTIDRIPVFAKAGGIVPLQHDGLGNATDNPEALTVLAFPGADGEFTMREDDGQYGLETRLDGMIVADTTFTLSWRAGRFVIGAVRGDVSCVPAQREWTLVFRGVAPAEVRVDGMTGWTSEYDAKTLSLIVHIPRMPVDRDIVVDFPQGLRVADNPVDDDVFQVFMDAQMPQMTKDAAYGLVRDQGVRALPTLRTMEHEREGRDDIHASHMPHSVVSALEEILLRG